MENVDFLGADGGQGEVAARLAANGRTDVGTMRPFINTNRSSSFYGQPCVTTYTGGDPKKLSSYQTKAVNANATLRRDEWKNLDEAVLKISETRLGGIQDLVSNNLVYNIGNGMGSTVLEYHDMSDAMEADLSMDGVTRSVGDRPKFGTKYLPLPIVHVDYEINTRVLNSSRSLGNPLDTTSAERAARKVNAKLETMLFTDTSYTFGGGTIYSYVNHPDRNPVTLSENWDVSGKTGAEIIADVLVMKQAAIDAKHYGPYSLYVPTAYETKLDNDYDSTTPGTTIRERILKIEGIKSIKVIDTLTANNVLLVEMNTDTVRLVRGMGVQNIQWQTEGNMITKYKVMTIQVPQVRADQEGNSGIVHLAA